MNSRAIVFFLTSWTAFVGCLVIEQNSGLLLAFMLLHMIIAAVYLFKDS